MRVIVDVPEYEPSSGLHLRWEPGFEIAARMVDGEIVVAGNAAGLLSLATHLLALAGAAVPAGTHLHLDADTGLEDGSSPLILQRS